jgi:adenylate cyclase
VRVGIHTGPAVAQGGDWYGRTVNVASRLCSVAAGGQVLVSDTTRTAAGRIPRVDFGERQLHWLRNVTEPIGTYSARKRSCAVHSVRAAAARFVGQRPGTARPLEAV